MLFRFGFLLLAVMTSRIQAAEPSYEAYAVRYATLKDYPAAALVQGADKGRKLDLAMTVWVLKGDGRVVLVDSGFYRQRLMMDCGVVVPIGCQSVTIGILRRASRSPDPHCHLSPSR